ncbi:MAG: hypothetical protein LKJ88_02150 [Bacilli bacterium]|jgi:hypothetical protein|nr:hypothetical protein [Bacilli bacterium]
MKSKSIVILSSVLGIAALVGAGFSAWVITQGAQATATGTITVDTVTDNSITINSSWVDGNNTIIFGGLASHPCAWLKNSDHTENLTCTLHLVVTNYTAVDTFTLSIAASNDTKYQSAVTANLVGALPTLGDKKAALSTGHGTIDVPVVFTWGSAFGNVNPETYYSTSPHNDYATYHTAASDNLTALHDDLSGVTFTITVTATAA